MIVYITTNLKNGKKYIGSHINNNPNYLGSGVYLKKAIKKYGKENFIRETLVEVMNIETMKELEVHYIEYYNAYKSPLFYNQTKYASGITKFPEDKKLNISNANKGNLYNLGRKQSKETIAKRVAKIKGQKFSKKTCQLISNSKIGNRHAIKTVIQYNLQNNFIKEWDCIKDAALSITNTNRAGTNIVAVCKGRKPTAYGYIWKYKND